MTIFQSQRFGNDVAILDSSSLTPLLLQFPHNSSQCKNGPTSNLTAVTVSEVGQYRISGYPLKEHILESMIRQEIDGEEDRVARTSENKEKEDEK